MVYTILAENLYGNLYEQPSTDSKVIHYGSSNPIYVVTKTYINNSDLAHITLSDGTIGYAKKLHIANTRDEVMYGDGSWTNGQKSRLGFGIIMAVIATIATPIIINRVLYNDAINDVDNLQ